MVKAERWMMDEFIVGFGGVAQLAEHMVCNHGVRGSSPLTSTISVAGLALGTIPEAC